MKKKWKGSLLVRKFKGNIYLRKRRVRRARKYRQNYGLNAWLALNLAILLCGFEAAYVQVVTTHRSFEVALFSEKSFLLLLVLDFTFPLCIALLSRRLFLVILPIQAMLTCILLHYNIFFYNPLTLSTMYHSLQGVGALGTNVFIFIRWHIILTVGILCLLKFFLVRFSHISDEIMPSFWRLRGITAVICISLIFWVSTIIYAKTGLSALWVDSRGHRTATERRLEDGTRETVRSLGYISTWLGEFLSGTYADLDLIYLEAKCIDLDTCNGSNAQYIDFISSIQEEVHVENTMSVPQKAIALQKPQWNGLPIPPLGTTIVLLQVESLDFVMVDMEIEDRAVMPFLNALSKNSLQIKVFAPHKVGSCNSDYEILNSRVAEQNVLYYDYITVFPDSLIAPLAGAGYHPAVFHGLEGKLFNLRKAYTSMGFMDTFFKEELSLRGYVESTNMLRQISDKDVFACALEQLRIDTLQAQFIVTMDSHIPFIKPIPEFARVGGTFARYISALHVFDQDLEWFYSQLPEGTVLILWGDHGSDVEYPRSIASNLRCVPFIVHVKETLAWIPENMQGTVQVKDIAYCDEDKKTTGSKEYTLCEISHYLKSILAQAEEKGEERLNRLEVIKP